MHEGEILWHTDIPQVNKQSQLPAESTNRRWRSRLCSQRNHIAGLMDDIRYTQRLWEEVSTAKGGYWHRDRYTQRLWEEVITAKGGYWHRDRYTQRLWEEVITAKGGYWHRDRYTRRLWEEVSTAKGVYWHRDRYTRTTQLDAFCTSANTVRT